MSLVQSHTKYLWQINLIFISLENKQSQTHLAYLNNQLMFYTQKFICSLTALENSLNNWFLSVCESMWNAYN